MSVPPTSVRSSRAEQVAATVEEEMLRDRLPVGAHLGRRAEFMERFGISPLVMNETLRILRTRGLVAVRRGTGGGLFVASLPPQVRLGAMDLWFHPSSVHPLELFEARVHLETVLTAAAFERATGEDIRRMEAAVGVLERAAEAGPYLHAVMDLHRVIATSSGIRVLDGVHQSIVAAINATLSRAVFVDGHAELLRHSVEVHRGLVDAVAGRNRVAFAKITRLHDRDLVRAGDPGRSPRIEPDPEVA